MPSNTSFDLDESLLFWCTKCNIPLLDEQCGICKEKGTRTILSPPGDVRFASPHEKNIINDIISNEFPGASLAEKLILLNKIPGEDKTDEIIVDGLHFGILRFDMSLLFFKLDLMVEGASALIDSGIKTKLIKISSGGRHLSGKNIDGADIIECSDDIRAGDTVLVTSKNLCGFGIAYRDSAQLKTPGRSLKIKKIGSENYSFLSGRMLSAQMHPT
jgi:phosphoadenosine phosphosulfate reductase